MQVDAARCGVGRNTRKRTWQMELGDVTCRRCGKLEQAKHKPEGTRTE